MDCYIKENITEEELADHFERYNKELDALEEFVPILEFDESLIGFQNLVYLIFHQ